MTDYKPNPGDLVHVTQPARVDSNGDYRILNKDGIDTGYHLPGASKLIVKVEPAPKPFPTEIGSMLIALASTSHGVDRVILELVDASRTGLIRPQWVEASTLEWIDPEDIRHWVQIDPQTFLPVEPTS